MIILAEINYTDGSTVSTLYYASEPFSSGDTYYDPRLDGRQLPAIQQSLQFPGERRGRMGTNVGDVIVLNSDKSLDDFLDDGTYGFDGQQIVLKVVSDGVTTTVFTGTMARAVKSFEDVRFVIENRATDLDRPIQTIRFEGDNALPAGVEGNDDIKGQAKPILYGKQENIPAPSVNQSKLIYQISDNEIDDVTAALHVGVGFVQGTDYSNLTDMENNEPDPGEYRVLPSSTGSYVRFGSSTLGRPLFDAQQGAASSNRTAGQIIKRILEDRAGYTEDDEFLASDITALDSANSSETGVWTGLGGANISDTLDKVAQTVGAYWGFDRNGRFRVKQFVSPSSETATINLRYRPSELPSGDYEILNVSWQRNVRIPTYRVLLRYRQMVEAETQFAAVVSQSRKNLRGIKWREVWSENNDIYDPATRTGLHLSSEPIEVEADFKTEANAQTEADRLLTLWSARQDVLNITLPLTVGLLNNLDVGTVAKVYADRYGYNDGVNIIVTDINLRFATGEVEVVGYGYGAGKTATSGGGTGSGTSDVTPDMSNFNPGTETWRDTVAPTVNDDVTIGVEVGHRWINTSTNKGYECADNSSGAAVWNQTFTVGESGALATLDMVNYPQLMTNAATNSQSDSFGGPASPGFPTWFKTCAISITTQGGPVALTFTGVVADSGAFSAGTGYNIEGRIRQGASTILWTDQIHNVQWDATDTLNPNPTATVSHMVIVGLSAGTYDFYAEFRAGAGWIIRNFDFVGIELRR